MLISSLIFVFMLISHSSGNELSRCCAGGSRHFREHGNCQSVRAVGSSPTCSRAGSICCLRAVIDSSCQAGFVYAQRHKVCSTVIINELAGGIKRECCDCCLLAKELVDRGEPCIAPTGFSPDCLNSFNKCCNKTESGSQSNGASSAVQSVSLSIDTDQTENGKGTGCEAANCEHLCTIREDGTAQCSCRSGFDLAPDGRTCVDIDECELLREHWTSGSSTQALLQLLPAMFRGMPLCDPRREVCINTEGGYGCRPAASTGKSIRRQYIKPKARPVVNVSASLRPKKQRPEEENVTGRDEAVEAGRFAYQTVGQTQAAPGRRLPFRPTPLPDTASAMPTIAAISSKTTTKPMTQMVVDVDECVSYGDALCSEFNTQCLNTEGAFSCVCSTGFYWSDGGSVCVDIDECLLLVDDCLESQRCLNTAGLVMQWTVKLNNVLVDECTLGAHDCGPMYQCKNTQGSFRCVPIRCADDQVLEPSSGECKSVNCPTGYRPIEGRCEDIDECKQQIRPCPIYEECVNTPGGYRCQEQGNVCTNGYFMDNDSGFCLDIDECQRGTHTCGKNGACINLPGTFRCDCAPGFEFNEYTMRCEDIDECVKFAGHACSLQADCINSIGSYHCLCKPGFRLAADNRSCDDIDECAMGIARCQQKCINSPGSYQCICDRGYQLGLDESTCEDIDECAIWAKSGSELCMGKCINTPGSFLCTCPVGYEILPDGITCKDIDECAQQGAANLCPGENSLCINLLGSYRCQRVECPRNYLPDRQYKNRCVKKPGFCENLILERCKKLPVHISWQHIAIPKQINISHHRTSVTLFSMKGPSNPNSTMQFELHLISAKPDFISVTPAVRANFLLQKGEDHNSATIALRDSLDGPQEVHLELVLRLNTNGVFNGKYVANLMVYVSQYRPQPQHDRLHRQHHRSRRFRFF